MFEEYAAVKPLDPWEIGQYLKRIGYTGSREPVKETLDALIYAHQCSVPFETLDPHDFGITVDLHPDAVFDKIVRKGRGGYCLELNGSFYRLLISLGFEVRPCLCRVLLGTEEWTHPIDHRTNLVTVGEGPISVMWEWAGPCRRPVWILPGRTGRICGGSCFAWRPICPGGGPSAAGPAPAETFTMKTAWRNGRRCCLRRSTVTRRTSSS